MFQERSFNLGFCGTKIKERIFVTGVFLYPLKALENLWFSGVLNYRKRPILRNGLKTANLSCKGFLMSSAVIERDLTSMK